MDGLLGPRVTWWAALGAGFSAAQQCAFSAIAIQAAAGQDDFRPDRFVVMSLASLAAVVWCGYFLALYRAERGLQPLEAFRRNTMLALVVVFGIRTFLLGVEIVSSIFLDPAGIATIAIGALYIGLWILVLVILGWGRLLSHVESIVTPLIVITVLQSLGTISALLRFQSPWVSAVNFIFVVTQILFLVALKSDPVGMMPGPPRSENR